MSDPCVVLVAESPAIPALSERFSSVGPLSAFNESDAVAALHAILARRPHLVVLGRVFATTPRGTALIARIKADASLDAVEIRVVSQDGAYSRTARRGRFSPPPSVAPAPEPTPILDSTGTRRAPRFRMPGNLETRVEGNVVTLVDLSTLGAQVLSPAVLRPNQRVQITFADGVGTVACRAMIAWASFERPQKGADPCYRAGLEFLTAPGEALEAFCRRNAC